MFLVGAGFAVMLFSVDDLRTSERRARHSEEVLVAANQLERLVVDLETGQRGFVITGEERFLEPWRAARTALPDHARALERLVADIPAQESRVRRISQKATSYLRDYSVPLINAARRDLASVQTEARADAVLKMTRPTTSTPRRP